LLLWAPRSKKPLREQKTYQKKREEFGVRGKGGVSLAEGVVHHEPEANGDKHRAK
jgi:hypothetical protein